MSTQLYKKDHSPLVGYVLFSVFLNREIIPDNDGL